jgi:hypothetical protein
VQEDAARPLRLTGHKAAGCSARPRPRPA